MTGPRHLWSGDWERETAQADADATEQHQQAQQDQQDSQQPADPGGKRPWRPNRRQLAATGAAVVVVAGVAVGLTAALDNSSKPKVHRHISPPPVSQSVPGGAGLTAPTQVPQFGTQPQTQPQTPPQTQTQTQTQTATIPNLPGIDWLGMQIITGPSGPVVSSLTLGGAGDAAGFEPGDVISQVNGQVVQSATQMDSILDKLPVGSTVQLVVYRGSTQISMAVTMKERPTVKP